VKIRLLLFTLFAVATITFLTGCGEIIQDQVALQPVYLAWEPVPTDENGDPLTDLAGYRIYYGQNPNVYTNFQEVPADDTYGTVYGLSTGTWYFSSTAYDSYGNQSDFSNEVSISLD